MRIQLIKSKKELSRMSTILTTIERALKKEHYVISEVNHIKGYIKVDPDRGAFVGGDQV